MSDPSNINVQGGTRPPFITLGEIEADVKTITDEDLFIQRICRENPQDCYLKYPSLIFPQLYLSGCLPATNKDLLTEHKINAILCVSDYKEKPFENIEYAFMYAQDRGDFNISKLFDTSYAFILDHLKKNHNVLVHCVAGCSRSATIVLYFILRYLYECEERSSLEKSLAENKPEIDKCETIFDSVYKYVQHKRPPIDPEPGFIVQLKKAEKELKKIRYEKYNKS